MSKDVKTWGTWTKEEINDWHRDNPKESKEIEDSVWRQQKEAERKYPLANDGA